MSIGRVPGVTGIQPSIVDAKGDLIVATAADSVDRLAVGTNEQRLVADSATATGLKYVADTTNYAIAAKGDLLVGTAADTLAALTVGTNGHTLVADSSTATGLKWAAPASGGMTLISTTTLSGSSTVVSSIPTTYKSLVAFIYGVTCNNNYEMTIRPNSTTGLSYAVTVQNSGGNRGFDGQNNGNLTYNAVATAGGVNSFFLQIDNYASSTHYKPLTYRGFLEATGGDTGFGVFGGFKTNSQITSLQFSTGQTFSAGTVELYGVA